MERINVSKVAKVAAKWWQDQLELEALEYGLQISEEKLLLFEQSLNDKIIQIIESNPELSLESDDLCADIILWSVMVEANIGFLFGILPKNIKMEIKDGSIIVTNSSREKHILL